jgi:serine/threonine-protein kinase
VLDLGTTPVVEARLEPGSYLLVVRRDELREVRYAVMCRRGEHYEAEIRLLADAAIGEDFIYVPGGRCLVGGGVEAYNPLPRQEVDVPSFAVARFPVTFGEYLEFLNDLQRADPEEAARRAPGPFAGDDTCSHLDERGVWMPSWDSLVEGIGRDFCPRERALSMPVVAVSWFDAVTYCRWRGERDGVAYRMPTEVEWEKAARGADGRFFPWGDSFDPSFCKMRESRPGLPQPEPVGSFPLDESPYGVRDMAGCVRGWTTDVAGQLSAAAALLEREPHPETPRTFASFRVLRGAAWSSSAVSTYAASRHVDFSLTRSTELGFRLVKPLP